MDKSLAFISDALDRTDSRDSFTEILQYSARLIAGSCPSQELAARRVYKSLSEGRKIYRLFRFIPEIRSLSLISEANPLVYHLLVQQSVASIMFYMLDNWIYLLETVKRKSRGDIRPFKYIKNRISLFRIIVSLAITMMLLTRARRKESQSTQSSETSNSRYIALWARLWHEILRLWLTLHKLHLLEQFIPIPRKSIVPDRRKFDILPGALGLASAVTGFIRRTVL